MANSTILKSGTILVDTSQDKWIVGSPIGAGGFGDIYLVSPNTSQPAVRGDCRFVAKVEGACSGPLFVETNFYLRVGKKDKVEEWKIKKNLYHLGMPCYVAFGSTKSELFPKYRFLILERYGPDIGSIFLRNGRKLSLKTVLTIGLQLLDVLEYVHYNGYIHADIKGSNLCLGLGKAGENKIYLLDYGLACLYVDRFGRHKEFEVDPRRAHDGTLEYTSRDAHQGVHSRRGDMEGLGYNFVQWLCGKLPWESDLSDPEKVAAAKHSCMSDVGAFLSACFPRLGPPVVLYQYLKYVANLSFTAKPDYEALRSLLRGSIRNAGLKNDGKLEVGERSGGGGSLKKVERSSDTENKRGGGFRDRISLPKSARKPCTPVQEVCDQSASRKSMMNRTNRKKRINIDWVKVIQSDPDRLAKSKQCKKKDVVAPMPVIVEDLDPSFIRKQESMANPTPAMVELMDRIKNGTQKTVRKISRTEASTPIVISNAPVLTYAMEDVIKKMGTRPSEEEDVVPSRKRKIPIVSSSAYSLRDSSDKRKLDEPEAKRYKRQRSPETSYDIVSQNHSRTSYYLRHRSPSVVSNFSTARGTSVPPGSYNFRNIDRSFYKDSWSSSEDERRSRSLRRGRSREPRGCTPRPSSRRRSRSIYKGRSSQSPPPRHSRRSRRSVSRCQSRRRRSRSRTYRSRSPHRRHPSPDRLRVWDKREEEVYRSSSRLRSKSQLRAKEAESHYDLRGRSARVLLHSHRSMSKNRSSVRSPSNSTRSRSRPATSTRDQETNTGPFRCLRRHVAGPYETKSTASQYECNQTGAMKPDEDKNKELFRPPLRRSLRERSTRLRKHSPTTCEPSGAKEEYSRHKTDYDQRHSRLQSISNESSSYIPGFPRKDGSLSPSLRTRTRSFSVRRMSANSSLGTRTRNSSRQSSPSHSLMTQRRTISSRQTSPSRSVRTRAQNISSRQSSPSPSSRMRTRNISSTQCSPSPSLRTRTRNTSSRQSSPSPSLRMRTRNISSRRSSPDPSINTKTRNISSRYSSPNPSICTKNRNISSRPSLKTRTRSFSVRPMSPRSSLSTRTRNIPCGLTSTRNIASRPRSPSPLLRAVTRNIASRQCSPIPPLRRRTRNISSRQYSQRHQRSPDHRKRNEIKLGTNLSRSGGLRWQKQVSDCEIRQRGRAKTCEPSSRRGRSPDDSRRPNTKIVEESGPVSTRTRPSTRTVTRATKNFLEEWLKSPKRQRLQSEPPHSENQVRRSWRNEKKNSKRIDVMYTPPEISSYPKQLPLKRTCRRELSGNDNSRHDDEDLSLRQLRRLATDADLERFHFISG